MRLFRRSLSNCTTWLTGISYLLQRKFIKSNHHKIQCSIIDLPHDYVGDFSQTDIDCLFQDWSCDLSNKGASDLKEQLKNLLNGAAPAACHSESGIMAGILHDQLTSPATSSPFSNVSRSVRKFCSFPTMAQLSMQLNGYPQVCMLKAFTS